MAIFGPGFFHVDTPQGERLTRNGSFTKDAQGFLRTSDGNYLLGQAGRIQIVENEFFVNGEGEIFVERQRTTPIGTVETGRIRIDRLRMSQVGDPSVLEREGDSLYFLPAEAMEAIEPGDVQIGQGYLEMSNVSAIEESIRLIDNYRAYQSSQRLVQAVDETLDKVINDVGRA
jgi:flagellar basal-body rod protein FlgG